MSEEYKDSKLHAYVNEIMKESTPVPPSGRLEDTKVWLPSQIELGAVAGDTQPEESEEGIKWWLRAPRKIRHDQGYALASVVCPVCGNDLHLNGANFCMVCGASLWK